MNRPDVARNSACRRCRNPGSNDLILKGLHTWLKYVKIETSRISQVLNTPGPLQILC